MSYLCYLSLFGSSVPLVVCKRVHVLFMLFVFVWFVFTSSYLCYLCLFGSFVRGFMSYLCYLCLFGSSLPPVVCKRVHVLFMLFVFVRFVFTSSCL